MTAWWSRFLGEKPLPEPKETWSDYAALEERVREIAASSADLHLDLVTSDTEFCDIDDSVGNLEIVMECEEVFDLEIPDDVAEQLLTVGQLTAYIARHLNIQSQISS